MWGIAARLLGGVLLSIAGSIAGRVLLSLGFGFVSFTGFTLAVDSLKSSIISNFGSMPAGVVSFLSWLWVDKAIGMIFSAFAAALVVQTLGGTSITKLVAKKP